MKIMTFLSDFGSSSSYVSQMKGVVMSLTDARIVDITHEITPYSIREGAFVLQTSVPHFPIGTVHVAVVDPGVGTSRRGIVITTRTHILVGPDNGLLIPTAKCLGDFFVYEITNTNLMLNVVSDTFHGRDVFAPIAAHILNGVSFDQIGPIKNDFVDLDLGKYEINNKTVTGKIVYIDSFGNIITNIDGFKFRQVLDFDQKIKLLIGKKQIELPFIKSYNFVKTGELLATVGSSNFFEIALNQGNASKKLKLNHDDEIKILFD